MVKVTVEKVERVWRKERKWERLTDSPQADGTQYGYVDAELPSDQRTLLLEQSIPEDQFDLKAVIRAVNGL